MSYVTWHVSTREFKEIKILFCLLPYTPLLHPFSDHKGEHIPKDVLPFVATYDAPAGILSLLAIKKYKSLGR